MFTKRSKAALAGTVFGFAMLGMTAGAAYAEQEPTATPGGTSVHEQMHRMMDGVHGSGTSQRIHDQIGSDAEKLMDQCTSAMGTGQNGQGMMGGQNGQGMMGGQNGQGTMGGQNGPGRK